MNENPKTKGFWRTALAPKGKLLTPFNVITIPVILVGVVLIVLRFTYGLGSVTNLSQEFPWGLWIGFDVLVGIAFAGGAYVLCFIYYIFGHEKYHPIIRVTTLNGFLAYSFYAAALILDLGRPWNAFNFLTGNEFGFSSVMFLVAWHFFLYTICLFVEFAPGIAEWIGSKRFWKVINVLNLGAVILGITLSIGHQSGVGALFLLAPAKIHPLWYSEFIPLLFLVSSVFAGLSMVIFEGSITHRVFRARLSAKNAAAHDSLVVSMARICALTMFVYFFLKLLELNHGQHWDLLTTPYGYLYLVEVVGFVLIPLIMFVQGSRNRSQSVIKTAAVLSMIGIALNRFNICVIAYNWYLPNKYYPTWMEVVVTLTVIFLELWVYRWVIHRMPVLGDSPEWAHDEVSKAAVQRG